MEAPGHIRAVYCLHETASETYSWMTYASALSLKHHHPDAILRCHLTEGTYRNLKHGAHPLLKTVDVETVAVPALESNRLVSRHLKIASGACVDGRFLFMDSDTLVARPIVLPTPHPDLSAAPDKFAGHLSGLMPDWVKPHYEILGWPLFEGNYYNSGIVFYGARVCESGFFQTWLEHWRATCRLGLFQDQPSFNHTIRSMGIDVTEMPPRLNSMVRVDAAFLRDASIMHFFESASSRGRSRYKDLLDDVRAGYVTSGRTIARRACQWTSLDYAPSVANLIANGRYREILTKVLRRMRLLR